MTLAAAGEHRMADPTTRLRVAIMVAALLGLGWTAVSLAGRPSGFYTPEELRHVGGLPFAPPQIQRRLPPAAPPGAELERQLQELSDVITGNSPVPQPSPSPGGTSR